MRPGSWAARGDHDALREAGVCGIYTSEMSLDEVLVSLARKLDAAAPPPLAETPSED
jgi:hypothetical protein